MTAGAGVVTAGSRDCGLMMTPIVAGAVNTGQRRPPLETAAAATTAVQLPPVQPRRAQPRPVQPRQVQPRQVQPRPVHPLPRPPASAKASALGSQRERCDEGKRRWRGQNRIAGGLEKFRGGPLCPSRARSLRGCARRVA